MIALRIGPQSAASVVLSAPLPLVMALMLMAAITIAAAVVAAGRPRW